MREVNIKMLEKLRNITFRDYLLVVGLALMLTGFVLFFYCVLAPINIITVGTLGNPLFYLILGLCVLGFRFLGNYIDLEVYEE